MSILVKEKILERLYKGDIVFEPGLDIYQLQAHSVDLRLGFTFLVSKDWRLTDRGRVAIQLDYGESSNHFETIELEKGQYFEVLPKEFVVVATLEKIKLPKDIMAVLYPRSSINRRGLSVDLSGIVDAGYEGNLIIPIRNNTSNQVVRVYPGERFCQLVFQDLGEVIKTRDSRWAKKDVVVGILKEKYPTESRLVRLGLISELKKKHPLNIKKKY